MQHHLAAAFLVVATAAPSTAQYSVVVIPPSDDATIYSESGSTANGSGDYLFVGTNNGGVVRRMLLRYDVAGAIPAGSIIVRADCYFFVNQGGTGFEPVRAHRVLWSWSAGPANPPGSEGQGTAAGPGDVTWTMREFGASLPWTTPGGDFASEISLEGMLPRSNVTAVFASARGLSDIQSWLDQPAQNFGWCWISNEVTPGSAKRLEASETLDSIVRPHLAVEYFPPQAHAALYCYPPSPNSAGAGALIAWTGSPSITVNNFALSVTGAPPGTSGMFFFGRSMEYPHPFGDGILCVPKPHYRLGLQTVGATGVATRALDLATFPGTVIPPMSAWTFQFWYRDTGFGGTGFNTSTAVVAPFVP